MHPAFGCTLTDFKIKYKRWKGNNGCRALQLFDGEREKERDFNYFLFLLFIFLPTPGLTHNYSTFLYRMSQKKKKENISLLLKKERFVYKEREQQKMLPFRCCMFFFYLLKDRKKTVIKCFLISGILFATERMRNYLFHWRLFK